VALTPHPILVPWSRKSRAIPRLPLRAVRPVQNLSACTRVHFTLPLLCSQNYGIHISRHRKLCLVVMLWSWALEDTMLHVKLGRNFGPMWIKIKYERHFTLRNSLIPYLISMSWRISQMDLTNGRANRLSHYVFVFWVWFKMSIEILRLLLLHTEFQFFVLIALCL